MKNKKSISAILLFIVFQFLYVPQVYASPETLLNDYFKNLETIIRNKHYKTHKAELTKFYDDHLSKDFHRKVMSEYDFKSCHEGVKDEHFSSSTSQNRSEFLEVLFPDGIKMTYGEFDYKITDLQVDEKKQEMNVDYSLDLGGEVIRRPGHQGIDIDFAPLIDLRKCSAVFSFKSNALTMESEQCEVVIKEGMLDSWEFKDFIKDGCKEKPTEDLSIEELKLRAEQGDAEAQFELGLVFYQGKRGFKRDEVEAFKWFEKSANQGFAYGQYYLGMMYHFAESVDQNDTEAFKLYMKAAQQGVFGTYDRLGIMYYTGTGVEKSYEDAFAWFMKAAKEGSAQGQNNVGSMYSDGEGVEQNYEQALIWFKKASAKGDGMALRNIGEMHEKGNGVEKSVEKALLYYQQACEAGYKKACSDFDVLNSKQ